MSNITFNPVVTTVAAGTFNVSSSGYIQGNAMGDPSSRNWLSGGLLGPNETLPMWGGVGISETTTPVASSGVYPLPNLGGYVTRATIIGSAGTAGALTGFSVFDQDHAMVNTPQSPVPLAGNGMLVNFYRFGSNARIPLAIDPSLITLDGNIITQLVSWDFALQRLVPYVAAYPANVITGSTWSGGQVTFTTTTNHGVAVGDDFTITGSVPAAYNGTYTAIAGTATNSLVAALTANPGSIVTEGTLVAGGGAVNCRVLDVQSTNNMTVSYDPVTGFATWNRNGACALVLI